MFDTNTYRKEVMKPLLDQEQWTFDDPFMVTGLDPDVNDASVIRSRLQEVVAFWRKEQSSPRYRNLATALLKERERFSSQLLDEGQREAIRQRVAGGRAERSREKFARLDAMVATLVERHGGIPQSRFDGLRLAARRAGVTDAEFEQRIAPHRIIAAEESVAPPPPAIRRQARGLLDEYARLEEAASAVRCSSLYDFVGVTPGAPLDETRARYEMILVRNRQRRHDRYRTVVDELLVLVESLLIDGDRRSYNAGLLEDVGDDLRPEVETALLLEDRITPVEFERILRLGVSAGLSAEQSRTIVLQLAREVGVPVESGAPVDYLACRSCGAANSASVGAPDPARRCDRCDEPLYRSCPSCQRVVEAGRPRCSGCSLDLRSLDEAEAELEAVRADLASGHLREANWRVDLLVKWASVLPQVTQLQREVQAALDGAAATWNRLNDAISASRFDDADRLVSELSLRAADVDSPDGSTLGDVRRAVASGLKAFKQRVADALALDGVEQETALIELAQEAPTSADVLGALRNIPVAAPSRVSARVRGRSVVVSWRRSPSVGAVEYRVYRTSVATDGSEVAGRPVGSTASCELEDAVALPGSLVTYEVQAVRNGITSGRASTSQLLIAPEVEDLAAVECDGQIELRWAPTEAPIWVERTDLSYPDAGMRRIRGTRQGMADSEVVNGHEYQYRVIVEYSPHDAPVWRTSGREIKARAFVLPDGPTLTLVTRVDRIEVLVGSQVPDVRVVRCATDPELAEGLVIDERRLKALGSGVTVDRGRGEDAADGNARWYLAAAVEAGQAVCGRTLGHPGLGEVTNLRTSEEGADVVVRWTWPTGCTEVSLVSRLHNPPSSAADPSASIAKITNTAYEIRDGYRLSELEPGQHHLLVLPSRRVGNDLVPIPNPAGSRVSVHQPERFGVSYQVRRAGLLRRGLQVEVAGGHGECPALELIGVGEDGVDPVFLGTIAPDQDVLDLGVEDRTSPLVVLLRPANAAGLRMVAITHPPPEQRTI